MKRYIKKHIVPNKFYLMFQIRYTLRRIRIFGFVHWITDRIWIRIRHFSSMAFQMPTKNNFLFVYYLLQVHLHQSSKITSTVIKKSQDSWKQNCSKFFWLFDERLRSLEAQKLTNHTDPKHYYLFYHSIITTLPRCIFYPPTWRTGLLFK